MSERSWIPVLVALGLLAAGLVVVFAFPTPVAGCARPTEPRSPLLSPSGMREQPDERLDTLVAAADGWAAPFGPVRAGVGYDYDQWLRLYGVRGGLLAFTKNNAPVVFVDSSLKARWALRPDRKRIAWDASPDRFVLAELAKGKDTRVGSYSLGSGKERWCVSVDADHADGQPVATAFLGDGDLLVALPDPKGLRVARLADSDGQVRWERSISGVARGDFLGVLGEDTFVAGGVEEHRLAQPDPAATGGRVIGAFRDTDGSRVWSHRDRPGSVSHVAGIAGGRVIVVTASAQGSSLTALDQDGEPAWTIAPRDGATESTVRGGLVLMRSRTGLDAYDARTGAARWHRDVPTAATYFPYGFTLGQMPSLEETHVLMPTTTALRVLDVTTGKDVAYRLPVDGISTTYWPYQLAVTDELVGVVTNTGGVVTGRE